MLLLTPLGRRSPLSLGPECGHCPAGHGAIQSRWESPTGAPRAGDRPGLQGEPRWLPGTGSPGFEREPKASSLHTSKGKPPCSSPGSSFSAGNSQGCLGPRCGLGWAGLGPPTHIPSKPCWAAARLPCPTQNLLRAPLTSSWGTEGEGRSSPAEGQGELLGKAPPLHRIPKGHPNTVPKSTRWEQSSQRALSQARRGQRVAAPVPARPCSALPLCQVHRGGFCVGGILFQTRFPLLTPPFRPRASPAPAPLLPHGLERFNHPCVGKGGED